MVVEYYAKQNIKTYCGRECKYNQIQEKLCGMETCMGYACSEVHNLITIFFDR
jgi:hypothetical protein